MTPIYFIIGQLNHENHLENRANTDDRKTTSNNTNNPIQVNGPQMDMHTLEKIIVEKEGSESGSLMTLFENRVQDAVFAVMTAVEDLLLPRVELLMISVNAFSGRDADSLVPDPDQRDFSANIEGLQMTASTRINTDLNQIDETRRSSIVVERGDSLVKEKNFDRQAHSHHS